MLAGDDEPAFDPGADHGGQGVEGPGHAERLDREEVQAVAAHCAEGADVFAMPVTQSSRAICMSLRIGRIADAGTQVEAPATRARNAPPPAGGRPTGKNGSLDAPGGPATAAGTSRDEARISKGKDHATKLSTTALHGLHLL